MFLLFVTTEKKVPLMRVIFIFYFFVLSVEFHINVLGGGNHHHCQHNHRSDYVEGFDL